MVRSRLELGERAGRAVPTGFQVIETVHQAVCLETTSLGDTFLWLCIYRVTRKRVFGECMKPAGRWVFLCGFSGLPSSIANIAKQYTACKDCACNPHGRVA